MVRYAVLLIVVATACADQPATIIDVNLSGSYRFSYAPPTGKAVTDERDDVLFNSPTTVPGCCLSVWRRGTTLEIGVGNWLPAATYPVAGACPPVAFANITVEGLQDGAQELSLDATNSSAAVYYQEQLAEPSDPADPCPRFADPGATAALSEPLTLTGQLKLADLHCDGGSNDSDYACALVGSGSWAFEAVDGITQVAVLMTSGSFQSSDQLGTL